MVKNTMAKSHLLPKTTLATIIATVVLLLTTQIVNILGETIPKAKEYTLADFDIDSVEPGFTLLSEDYAPAWFPYSMKRVNGPEITSKNWHITYEFGSWEPTVGTMFIPTEDRKDHTHCQPTEEMKDLSGYIVGVPATLGCSHEVMARAYKEVGATGMIILSGFPIAGLPGTFWNGLNNDDVLDFPTIQLGGFDKYYLTMQHLVGNETVVAIAKGDPNLHLVDAWTKPMHLIPWFLSVVANTTLLVMIAYVRKLIYDFAPTNKKWERNLASTCIELEFLITLFRSPYAISYGSFRHFFPSWFVHGPHVQTNGDVENVTTVLLIIYFYQIRKNSKSMAKSSSMSKAIIIATVLICLPGSFASLLYGLGFVVFNWRFVEDVFQAMGISGFSPLSLIFFYKSIFSIAFAAVYVVSGIQFLVFLRKSSSATGSLSKEDPRVKMQKRMMFSILLSAVSMFMYGFLILYFSNESNPAIVNLQYFTPGGPTFTAIITLLVAIPVTAVQVYAFAAPVLRKKIEAEATKNAKSTNNSSATSSSSTTSTSSTSGISSSSASSSADVSSSAASSK